jgi:hypothetical protein
MAPRQITTFRIDQDLLEGLREVFERDGVTVPEQVRRAIRAWLEAKGVMKKTERKRAGTRKRP